MGTRQRATIEEGDMSRTQEKVVVGCERAKLAAMVLSGVNLVSNDAVSAEKTVDQNWLIRDFRSQHFAR